MRIAVIGSGISGVSDPRGFCRAPTMWTSTKPEPQLGGHTRTLDVTADGPTFPVDTGFMVFNRRTYPNLIRFFEHLGISAHDADMSFSVQVADENIEWSGDSLNSVFAQRKNIANPRFLRMLTDVRSLQPRRRSPARRPLDRRTDLGPDARARGLQRQLHGLVPDPHGWCDLVHATRRHARLPGRHVPALLRQPRTAAHHRQAAVAFGQGRSAHVPRDRLARLLR